MIQKHIEVFLITRKVKIQNKLGLHARPCSLLVKAAQKFRSELQIKKDDMIVNGKSIMGVMMLAAEFGSELQLILDGVDEEDAMIALIEVFNSKFGED